MSNHCLLTAPDRVTADLFYRGVQENMKIEGVSEFTNLDRHSPQLWVFGATNDSHLRQLLEAIHRGDPKVSGLDHLKRIRGKVFLHLIGNYATNHWPILPSLEHAVEHVDRMACFIRNKSKHHEYWYASEGVIKVSTEKRSRFLLEFAKKPDSKRDLVLIDKDSVKLSLIRNDNTVPINKGRDGFLQTDNYPATRFIFDFGELSSGIELGTGMLRGKDALEGFGADHSVECLKWVGENEFGSSTAWEPSK
ncbi:uncharacterized protein N7469_000878 [Penicillium citrinum]|uniref:Uncharacterized protein n=1 Tax=Penicillium citrinum TaxID=5077 RepID=A0A9W9PDS2_PENCI|nr:uncharacterized protein N7469_000878 [Penicillium citrinum]KAJ5242551.1 hypothetical protein N7469_000878 [Penicillium citrinum]